MAKRGSTVRNYKDIGAWVNAQPKSGQARLKIALSELRRLFKSPQHDDLCWWHRVGKRMLVLQPKEDRRYGSSVVELIADHVEQGREREDKRTPNRLYRTRDFAEKYSWREAQKLDRERRNGLLAPLHVTALVSLDDKGLRDELLERCLEERWSGQRLRREIQNVVGRKRSSGGLSPIPPADASPGVALRDTSILARRWMTNYEAWFVGKRAPLGPDQLKACDEATLKEVESAIKGLTEVHGAAREQLKRLRQFQRDIKESLRAQQRRPT